jgi:hypothetical protein
VPDHRLEICPVCRALFSICRDCDRGQLYCRVECQRLARRKTARSAHRRHRQSDEGRDDHRDAERARRARRAARVGDHGSEKLTASGTVPAPARARDSEVEPSDENASGFLFLSDPALAEEMLRRGALLEPEAADWHDLLARLRFVAARDAESDDHRRRLGREALAEYDSALRLETRPLRRYGLQIRLGEAAYEAEEYSRAAKAATSVLAEAPDFETTFAFGNGIHSGHIVLGRVALATGDLAAACDHLAAAGATRGSPQLNSFGPDFRFSRGRKTPSTIDARR